MKCASGLHVFGRLFRQFHSTKSSTATAPAAQQLQSDGSAMLASNYASAQRKASSLQRAKRRSALQWAKIILPHIGLMVLSCLYASVGAVCFYYLEKPNELSVRHAHLGRLNGTRHDLMRSLWITVVMNATVEDDSIYPWEDQAWETEALIGMDNLTRTLYDAFDTQYIRAAHIDSNATRHDIDMAVTWTFWNAVFFTSTLLTTIGYGNVVPMTFEGRMFCLCYGLFGVPLILITVADIGKFLSEHIVWLYCNYVEARKSLMKKCCSARNRHASTDPIQMADIVTEEQDEINKVRDELERFGLEDYVSIPVSLVLSILMAYVTIGALLLGCWEDWDFFTGFYFSFITMTTVGFGDIVPEKQEYFLLDLLYIIIGLAITTMCIDLVGIQYIRKIHYFGRAIKDARYALVNVGGRMVHVGDLMKYASVLQQKYGLRAGQVGAFENPFELFPGSYKPKDLRRIRFIDSSMFEYDHMMRTRSSIDSIRVPRASLSGIMSGGTRHTHNANATRFTPNDDTIYEE